MSLDFKYLYSGALQRYYHQGFTMPMASLPFDIVERAIPHFSVVSGIHRASHEGLLYHHVKFSPNHNFLKLAYGTAHPSKCIIGYKMPFAACLDVHP